MTNPDLLPIFLVVGAPASGKSTASRALAARYPKSIAICVDDLRTMVISGVVHPSATWSSKLTEQLQLARKTATEMAERYHAAGFAVVIDDFFDPYTQLREYDALLAHETMRRVVLYPSQQKAHERNRQRLGSGAGLDYLDEGIRDVYRTLQDAAGGLVQRGWILLDTTDDTVEETAGRLQALIG